MSSIARCILLALLWTVGAGCATGARDQHASTATVELLAMGDWGIGSPRQKDIADALRDYVSSSGRHFDGMLLAGDNFYVELTGTNDPAWQRLFETMYDPVALSFPFYAALGNHDYQHDKHLVELQYARENPQSRWKLPSRWYRVDLPDSDPMVTVLVLDSNKDLMSMQDWNAQKKWIARQLFGRTGAWTVAVAHHPLYSNGSHGDNGVLQREWGPMFARHSLDIYICGHDHDLQHLQLPNTKTSFLLVGGGGADVRDMRNDKRGPFSRSLHGFADLRFEPDQATVSLVGANGSTVHQFVRTRKGKIRVVATTPSDVAKPRTVRSVTRGEKESTRPARQP